MGVRRNPKPKPYLSLDLQSKTMPWKAGLILEYCLGIPSFPDSVANELLDALPCPSHPTPRLRRAILLRELARDPVSESSLDDLHHLASLPAAAAASRTVAANIAVAAFVTAAASDFDATASDLFARPDGRARRALSSPALALASRDAIATADQFEAAIGNPSSQTTLRALWGDRASAEEQVRELLAAEWAAFPPSTLGSLGERIGGDGAVDNWRAADEATRAKYAILVHGLHEMKLTVGEEATREILAKLKEPTSTTDPTPTPAVEKATDTLKASCVVEDSLPADKAVADEVLAAKMDKGVSLNAQGPRGQRLNAQGPRGQPTTCGAAGPSRRHLPSARRRPPQEKKSNQRRPRKPWNLEEEDTLRKAVRLYGVGNWKDILNNNLDAFFDRTTVDLKDKWRTMTRTR